MRDMRESGVEWIGDIPETWELGQLGSLFFEHKHKNTGMQSNNLLSLSYGNIIRKDINTSDGLLPESFEGYNVIDDGDIVLRLTDLQNDQRSLRVGLSHEKGIVTSAYVTLRRRNPDLNSQFFYYLIHSYDVRKGFYGMGAGVRQGLNYAGVKKIMLTLPPVEEQAAIAAFLEDKLAKVDTLIANVQAQIEKLKAYKQSMITEVVTKGLDLTVPMKESGVDWIGEIPEEWDLIKLKYITHISRGLFNHRPRNDPQLYDGPYPFIQTGDVARAKKYITTYSQTLNERGISVSKQFPKGTMTMTIAANVGDVAILGFDAYFPDSVVGFTVKSGFDEDYVYYLFQALRESFIRASIVSTQLNLNIERSKEIVVSVTYDKQEQKEIAAYLEKECEQIERLISIKQAKIEKLEQYKKSLIYEYVTGKKEVC